MITQLAHIYTKILHQNDHNVYTQHIQATITYNKYIENTWRATPEMQEIKWKAKGYFKLICHANNAVELIICVFQSHFE